MSDLSAQIANMIQTSHTVVGNVAAALADTLSNVYNPLLLPQQELAALKRNLSEQDHINLNIHHANIFPLLVSEGSAYYIVYSMPIESKADYAIIYSVNNIPLYYNSVAHRAQLDSMHFAVFQTTGEYSVLTTSEFTLCQSKSALCKISGQKSRMTSSSPCTVQTFSVNQLKCPLAPTNETEPMFQLHGTRLLYSTPKETHISAQCQLSSSRFETIKTTLNGAGTVEIPRACSITLPNGSSLRTPPFSHVHRLDES